MRRLSRFLLSASLALTPAAWAAPYVLSPDGSAVVRLVSQGTAAASGLGAGMMPAGWTIAGTGSGGSMSVTSYTAGFSGSTGGAEIRALFDRGSAPPSGSYLEWVQVLNTNLPLGGATSPYLDNAADRSRPFYSLTAANTTPGLPARQLNFYDFSQRDPASLATTNPITWEASLYPVVANASNALTVYDGVTWGWNMKKATVGTVAGTFTGPSPASAVVSGVGTSTFSWGTGPSWLSFVPTPFDTAPNTPFKLGTLTFHNGTNASGSSADSVTFNAALDFLNVPELNSTLSTLFSLVNTTNTSDPIESADYVSLGSFGYTFHVLEEATASVDVMAMLSTGLLPSRAGTSNGAALAGAFPLEPTPSFALTIVGLTNPTAGGFVEAAVPEPSSLSLGLLAAAMLTRRRRH